MYKRYIQKTALKRIYCDESVVEAFNDCLVFVPIPQYVPS